MGKDVNGLEYIDKLLVADRDTLVGLWWNHPDDLFERVDVIHEPEQCSDINTYKRYIYKCNVNGKFYEYSYKEDYFGEQSHFSFREVEKKPVVNYIWE